MPGLSSDNLEAEIANLTNRMDQLQREIQERTRLLSEVEMRREKLVATIARADAANRPPVEQGQPQVFPGDTGEWAAVQQARPPMRPPVRLAGRPPGQVY